MTHEGSTDAYIEDIARSRRAAGHHPRLAPQPPVERQDPLSDRPRRQRVHPGRDVEGRRRRGDVPRGPITSRRRRRSSSPARVRADHRAPGGYEIDVVGARGRRRVGRLPDHAEGARRRLPDGPPAPVDPLGAAARHPARPARGHRRACGDFFDDRGFILADTPIFTPAACEGTTTLFPVHYFDDADGVPDAERPALQRGQRDGARPRLLLRPDVPRREVEDAPPPDRVLDGRAGGRLRRRSTTSCELAEDLVVSVVERVLDRRRRELKRLERDTTKLERVQTPFPRISLRRGGRVPQRRGPALRVGRRPRRRRRDDAVAAVRPPGLRAPLPGRR